eukprot:TRINITY_DN14396_c0_g1_i2.p1 TRINITY_DN14396_c0_g1~~TRINITY_DN14396_c0_g1_i2.p1  ORF type:complete len:507 (+),score=67.04 TRINITY_DN14396_c0_g1_i2:61-1581(+)
MCRNSFPIEDLRTATSSTMTFSSEDRRMEERLAKSMETSPTPSHASGRGGQALQSPLARWLAEPATFELESTEDGICAWHPVPARIPASEPDVLNAGIAVATPRYAVRPAFALLPAAVAAVPVYPCVASVPCKPAVIQETCGPRMPSSCVSTTSSCHDLDSDEGEPLRSRRNDSKKMSASAARRRRRQKAASFAAVDASGRRMDRDDAILSEGSAKVAQPAWSRDPVVQRILLQSYGPKRCAELTAMLARGGQAAAQALQAIHGSMLALSLDANGCRLVQEAFEVADQSDAAVLAHEFQGHVWTTIASPHGNYVVQKMVEVLPSSIVRFIVDELRGYAMETACHRFGCRVLCRLLEHTGSEASTIALMDEVLLQANALFTHEYGHYVIESMLEHGKPMQLSLVARALCNDAMRYAGDAKGAFVMKAALSHCTVSDAQRLVEALFASADQMLTLAQDRCGHHVVLALLRLPAPLSSMAWSALQRLSPQLRSSKYGCRVLEEADSHCN